MTTVFPQKAVRKEADGFTAPSGDPEETIMNDDVRSHPDERQGHSSASVSSNPDIDRNYEHTWEAFMIEVFDNISNWFSQTNEESFSDHLDPAYSYKHALSKNVMAITRSVIAPFLLRFPKLLVKNGNSFTKDQSRFLKSSLRLHRNILVYVTPDNKEQSFVKYFLDVLMCRVFLDAQRPPKPSWVRHNLFVGIFGRMVARTIAKRDLTFIYSLQKGSKQSWPALSKVKELQSLQAHADRLSRRFEHIHSHNSHKAIERAVRQVFRRPDRPATKIMPSGSACLQANREEGGCMALFPPFILSERAKDAAAANREFEMWRETTYLLAKSNAIDERTLRADHRPSPLYLQESTLQVVDPSDFPRHYIVKTVSLPEPAKFRIITKMDGYMATALQPLQGMLLLDWKESIYSTMMYEELTDRVQRIENLSPFSLWCSGDYEAATDLLNAAGSLAVARILKDLGYPDTSLLLESLSRKVVVYPDEFNLPSILSEEGQLMGHPCSFPILCVLNLAVYFESLRLWILDQILEGMDRIEARSLEKFLRDQVIVNGDDILFKTDERLYNYFLQVSRKYGLNPSIGKNYLSPDCCMINSQVFKISNKQVRRIRYLNQRFLFGTNIKKTVEQDQVVQLTEFAQDVNRMFDAVPWSVRALPFIAKRATGIIRHYKPNWFIPVHLGGLGIDPKFANGKIEYTRDQRILAARLLSIGCTSLMSTRGIREGLCPKNKDRPDLDMPDRLRSIFEPLLVKWKYSDPLSSIWADPKQPDIRLALLEIELGILSRSDAQERVRQHVLDLSPGVEGSWDSRYMSMLRACQVKVKSDTPTLKKIKSWRIQDLRPLSAEAVDRHRNYIHCPYAFPLAPPMRPVIRKHNRYDLQEIGRYVVQHNLYLHRRFLYFLTLSLEELESYQNS